MLFCNQCNMTIAGDATECPLCQGRLEGTPEAAVFPSAELRQNRVRLVARLGLLAVVLAGIVCFTINWATFRRTWWSLYVIAGMLCGWVAVNVGVAKKANPPKSIVWQQSLWFFGALIWDFATGWHGWSVSYVCPAVCTAAMVGILLLALAMRLRAAEYLMYQFLSCGFGLSLLIPLFLQKCTRPVFAALCVATSVSIYAYLLIVRGRATQNELKKKLHL